MTPDQIEAVSRTAAIALDDADRFARLFYDRLFALSPEARSLFPTDMEAQQRKLVDELAFLASATRDLDRFVERAKDLGRRHQSYGVTVDDYRLVEIALLQALGTVVGADWTPDVELAWTGLYALISETMVEGTQGNLFGSLG